MAETLTVNTTPDTETLTNGLTSDEQDSLAVGEQLVAEQENLLAGKYKNAEELEKAYGELQKKLGNQEETTEEEDAQTEDSTEEESEETDWSPAASLISDASAEYAETGEITTETMAKFSEMSSADLVNAYMEIQSQVDNQAPVAEDISDSDVNVIRNYVGGEQAYDQLIDWAGSNLDENSQVAFDSIINTGSVDAIKLAVAGIKAQMDEAVGYDGRMLSGKPPRASGDVFRSQAEVVAAMEDPRYERDPAYRQDLIDKLDRSDIQF